MTDSSCTALVIGGCRGIGKAVSLRLAADGFSVVATCRKAGSDSEALRQLVPSCRILELDVTRRAECRQILEREFPPENAPFCVVYNSGIARDNLLVFMEDGEWDQVIDTNLTGFFNVVKPLLPGMLSRRTGRIVAVSSASGQTGQAGQTNYSAAKAGLIGAVKALAREVGRKNVLVNAVAPGVIDTEMIRGLPLEQVLPLVPLRRVGSPEEVAGAVSFLCGKDASYIHGQVLAVNGGLVI